MIERKTLSRSRWRQYVTAQLQAAGVDVEYMASGAIRIIRGAVHLTITDLSNIRDSELKQLTR